MNVVLGNARPLLLIGVVMGLAVVSGCDHAIQEPLPSGPEDELPPESQPSGGNGGSSPEILESWQSVSSTSGGGSVTLRVQARPPREGTLGFSWQSQTGTLGTPSTTATSSEIVWIAPVCGVGLSTHTLQVSLRHSSGLSSSTSFEISVVCPRWISTQDNLVIARNDHTASVLPSGKVLVAGGMDAISIKSAEVYDPDSRTWSPTAPLITARSHHVACLLPSGQVLVA